MTKTTTYHVLHILVQNQYEAQDLIPKIKSEKDFRNFARKLSLCSSAKQEGDLGEVRWGRAHEDFEEGVQILRVGSFSTKPLRTPFGYHLIWRLK